ncbi:MAG: D-Ala-D-Ala carboxypeptidase family metallohydrolase [Gemmatimonadaceae bacterium]
MRFRRLSSRPSRRLATLLTTLLLVIAARAVWGGEVRGVLHEKPEVPPVRAELVNMPVVSRGAVASTPLADVDFASLFGRSGQLRVRLLTFDEVDAFPALIQRFGDQLRTPGIRQMVAGDERTEFSFVTLTPWRKKLGSYVNGYHLGLWPGEQRLMPANYENPDGFIEVMPEHARTRVSTHFTLGDFLTHDQKQVWPKYVVLREELLDKLELVLEALQSFGVATEHVVVLSGFRSPQYNSRGGGEGMARSSRHQFGDAADIIVDANRDGRMDDLNNDGRVDFSDTQVIDRAVGLVESRYPELVGGLGLYHETGPSGPFAHIDVRGTRARWTNGARPGPQRVASGWRNVSSPPAEPSGKCQAEGVMAVLCQGAR